MSHCQICCEGTWINRSMISGSQDLESTVETPSKCFFCVRRTHYHQKRSELTAGFRDVGHSCAFAHQIDFFSTILQTVLLSLPTLCQHQAVPRPYLNHDHSEHSNHHLKGVTKQHTHHLSSSLIHFHFLFSSPGEKERVRRRLGQCLRYPLLQRGLRTEGHLARDTGLSHCVKVTNGGLPSPKTVIHEFMYMNSLCICVSRCGDLA